MTETPERIWAWSQTGITRWSHHGDGKDTTEYVRADLLDEAVKALREIAGMNIICASDHANATLAKLRSKT